MINKLKAELIKMTSNKIVQMSSTNEVLYENFKRNINQKINSLNKKNIGKVLTPEEEKGFGEEFASNVMHYINDIGDDQIERLISDNLDSSTDKNSYSDKVAKKLISNALNGYYKTRRI